MAIFSCGKAFALSQDWPCDDFVLNISGQGQQWGHTFHGQKGDYEVTIPDYDETAEQPDIYNCGNAGCSGIIKNTKTGKSTDLRFDCLWDKTQKTLTCRKIDGNEYLLTQSAPHKYTVVLCGLSNVYINSQECSKCKCILHNSEEKNSSSDREVRCRRENENQIRCFNYYGYEKWRNFENKDTDFENCVGLNL